MTWQADLAMIRQRAAARCGLREYPSELIRISEALDRAEHPARPDKPIPRWHTGALEQRRAELEAGLRWIR